MRRLRDKILLFSGSLILTVVLAVSFLLYQATSTQVWIEVRSDLDKAVSVFKQMLHFQRQLLLAQARYLASSYEVSFALVTGKAIPEEVAPPLSAGLNADTFLLTDENGLPILDEGRRPLGRELAGSPTLIRAAKGTEAYQIWSSKDALFQLLTVPVKTVSNKRGALTLGFRMEQSLARNFRDITGCEIGLFSAGRLAVATGDYPEHRHGRAIDCLECQRMLQRAAQAVGGPPAEVQGHGQHFITRAFQLGPQATAVVVQPLAELETLRANLAKTLGIAGVLLVLTGTIFAFFVARTVTAPLRELTEAAMALAGGDYTAPVPRRARDEIGFLAETFDAMRRSLQQQIASLAEKSAELQDSYRQLQATNRQLREAQAELVRTARLASMGELAAGVAHEINNPLGVILGFTQELLEKTPADRPEHATLKILEQESLRTSRIIRELLEFARPQAPQMTAVDLVTIIESSLPLLESSLKKGKIELQRELAAELPPVAADPHQLQQVVINLMLNAIHALPHGGQIVLAAAAENGSVRFEVRDNGEGIARENLGRIFEPFFSTKGKRGTGMGLAICKRIIEDHGGEIAVDSAPGRGTSVRVFLPAAGAELVGQATRREEQQP
jgi:signal transduction histidine kinase